MSPSSPYETSARPEIHGLIPHDAKRILDVGCNDGGFGAWAQAQSPEREVWGIEPNANQAAVARQSLSGVVTGVYPDALDGIPGDFDCITFNHVLEHMLDPWGALSRTHDRLTRNGVVVAVIPNVRYVGLLIDLALKGKWEYQETGLLDRTHVRFFTRSSIIPLFEDAGLSIQVLEPVNRYASQRAPRLSRGLGAVLRDLSYGGFAIRAGRA